MNVLHCQSRYCVVFLVTTHSAIVLAPEWFYWLNEPCFYGWSQSLGPLTANTLPPSGFKPWLALLTEDLKVPPLSKYIFLCCFFSWMFEFSLWRRMYVQSLTLRGCFHTHLLKLLMENLFLRGRPTNMIWSQSWSNNKSAQVWFGNLKSPLHLHWDWTLQRSRRHLRSRS